MQSSIDSKMAEINLKRETKVLELLSGQRNDKLNYASELQKKFGQKQFDIKKVAMNGPKMSLAEQKFNSKENQARIAAINKKAKEDAFLGYIFVSEEQRKLNERRIK